MFGIPLVFTGKGISSVDIAITVLITEGFPPVETVLRGLCIASFVWLRFFFSVTLCRSLRQYYDVGCYCFLALCFIMLSFSGECLVCHQLVTF